ncbi:MAG: redox-sensing transcriptional repressor Rex, partial [Alicyclobacillus sp.]|nr:redox-sensing transcriptional repressor Rex [Alicyclobacillus sp.]
MTVREWGVRANGAWMVPTWPSQRVKALFSLRQGGVSFGAFTSLNVGFHVGDEVQRVLENRRRCATRLGGTLADWVLGEQVHGASVAVVTRADRGRGALQADEALPGVDALVTADPEVTLVVLTADCVPVLLYDPVRHAAAAVHSGWRGTAAHVTTAALAAMQARGLEVVSSQELGEQLGVTPAQIRKDLSYFGRFGKQGRGYNVNRLMEELRQILGLDRTWQMVLVGVGQLGRAILHYGGFGPQGFHVVEAFDASSDLVGARVGSVTVRDVAELPSVLATTHVE